MKLVQGIQGVQRSISAADAAGIQEVQRGTGRNWVTSATGFNRMHKGFKVVRGHMGERSAQGIQGVPGIQGEKR